MRLDDFIAVVERRRLDQALVMSETSILSLTGIRCDNGILEICRAPSGRVRVTFFTDFRYIPMVHRVAPRLACRDIKSFKVKGKRVGFEFALPHATYLAYRKKAPKPSSFLDISGDLATLRLVKTDDERTRLREAEALACEIWNDASKTFKAGMTEREMAAVIKKMMIDRGEGEAFSTIVCVGKNAAECHHEPDDTVWNGKESVLVDMGVRYRGVCSDLTRNLVPKASPLYKKVYALVLQANEAAIAAAKPGIRACDLDKVAREIIRKGGFGKCFGHSLGHGVGYEIHEAPTASSKCTTTLEPGMTVTIEPGIYLEGNLGVRIEDLVLITDDGCEVLSSSAAK